MTLLEKLNTINVPRVTPLQDGKALTAEEFWDSFIVQNLPEKDVVLKWHKVLMEYVNRPDAMFAIRGYNTAPRDNYDSLRRGFLTRTNAGYSFFYTDNFHAAYFLKMALDGYVPTVDEMVATYNSRRFPARFGRDTSNERAMMAMPRGVDPGIQTAGYKIAHILNVGKDYYLHGQSIPLSRIIQEYFDGGERNDWKWHTDITGSFFLRECKVCPDARKYLVAEYLRFVHPFNYFLTPKKNCAISPVSSDIAEYQPLVDFVQAKYAALYGDAYREFLSLVMSEKSTPVPVCGSTIIDLKYRLNSTGAPVSQIKPRRVPPMQAAQSQNRTVPSSPVQLSKELELRIVTEYLVNPQTSFRKLERQFMGIDSPARGGGFAAKNIVNSYGIVAEMKGILVNRSIEQLIQSTTGKRKNTLIAVEKLLHQI